MSKRPNKNQIKKNKSFQQVEQKQLEIHAQCQGPIPPPDFLASYESIHAGLADRIVAMAEKEQAHSQEME